MLFFQNYSNLYPPNKTLCVQRGVNHGNEIEASWDDFWVSFKPELWEEIIIQYNSTSNLNIFKTWFKNRMNAGVWQDYRVKEWDLTGIAKNIWENWNYYNSLWQNSNKNKRIRIKIARTSNYDFRMTGTGIRTGDSQIYENSYEDQRRGRERKWNNDFSYTTLGSLNNNSDKSILDAVKIANPGLDVSQIYIEQKNNTSAFIKAKNNSASYGVGARKEVYFKIKSDLENIIRNKSLHNLNNNSDTAILNELKYLNPDLDISQLEIEEKENNSFVIKIKKDSNKYIGEKKIYYSINNQINRIINLDELIKKGIFLGFRDKNQGITIKEIKNINTSNLIYSNVTAIKNIEPTYTKNSKSICFGTTTLFHNLPTKKNMKTPSCKYTKETTVNSQITTGLSKTNSEEKRTEQTSTSSMEHNWNIELSTSGGIWPFSNVSETIGGGGSYGSSETNTSSEAKTLSNTFDFSNSKTNEYKEASEVELPSQEIEVNPNQKIKVTASLDEVLAQVTLKLTQNIYGEITSQITNTSNEEKSFKISIKEIMQKLKQYNLLPQEITINNNDSITFNGNANRSLKQGFDGNIEFHEVK